MKAKELIEILSKDPEANVFIPAYDEDMDTLYRSTDIEVTKYENGYATDGFHLYHFVKSTEDCDLM